MRYINSRFTYLLTYLLDLYILWVTCIVKTNFPCQGFQKLPRGALRVDIHTHTLTRTDDCIIYTRPLLCGRKEIEYINLKAYTTGH